MNLYSFYELSIESNQIQNCMSLIESLHSSISKIEEIKSRALGPFGLEDDNGTDNKSLVPVNQQQNKPAEKGRFGKFVVTIQTLFKRLVQFFNNLFNKVKAWFAEKGLNKAIDKLGNEHIVFNDFNLNNGPVLTFGWFYLTAPQITEEVKQLSEVLVKYAESEDGKIEEKRLRAFCNFVTYSLSILNFSGKIENDSMEHIKEKTGLSGNLDEMQLYLAQKADNKESLLTAATKLIGKEKPSVENVKKRLSGSILEGIKRCGDLSQSILKVLDKIKKNEGKSENFERLKKIGELMSTVSKYYFKGVSVTKTLAESDVDEYRNGSKSKDGKSSDNGEVKNNQVDKMTMKSAKEWIAKNKPEGKDFSGIVICNKRKDKYTITLGFVTKKDKKPRRKTVFEANSVDNELQKLADKNTIYEFILK